MGRGKYKKFIEVKKDAPIYAKRIATIMNEKGWSQKDLSERCNGEISVSEGTITGWLQGVNGKYTEPKIKAFNEVARVLGVSVDYLLGLNPNPTTDTDKSAVCLYTGLSQSSVEKVVSITKIPSRPGLIDLSKALNFFLSGSHLVSFIMLFWNFMREADKMKQLEIVFVDKLEYFGEKRPKNIIDCAAKLSLESGSCVHAEALELVKQNDQVRYAMFRLQNSLNSITDEYMEEGEL